MQDLYLKYITLLLSRTLIQHQAKSFIAVGYKHAPFKKLRIKRRANPWFSSEICELLKVRDFAWKKACVSVFRSDWQHFRYLRNKSLAAIWKVKSSFYLTNLSDPSSNFVEFWRTLKSLSQYPASALPVQIIKDFVIFSNKRKLCDIFNQHFVNAGHLFENVGLLPTVPSCVSRPYVPVPHNSCNFSLQPLSEGEVLEALGGIEPKQSTEADKIKPSYFIAGFIFDC